jgi:hypothetical protein
MIDRRKNTRKLNRGPLWVAIAFLLAICLLKTLLYV